MKRFLIPFVFLFVFCCFLPAQTANIDSMLKRTALVQNDTHYGTGVFVTRTLVITSSIFSEGNVKVNEFNARVIKVDEKMGISLLEINGRAERSQVVPISDNVAVGSNVFVVHLFHQQLNEMSVFFKPILQGFISVDLDSIFFIQTTVLRGLHGAAVFNSEGYLVGIVSNLLCDPDCVLLAVGGKAIKAFYKQEPKKEDSEKTPPKQAPPPVSNFNESTESRRIRS